MEGTPGVWFHNEKSGSLTEFALLESSGTPAYASMQVVCESWKYIDHGVSIGIGPMSILNP